MKRLASLAALAAALVCAPLRAQEAPPPAGAPKLIVVISVDQFSADLLAEYREHATGGLARLLKGAVFPHGFQSHAATETCPGHSTILTGFRPEHTGIIANNWIDQRVGRADKSVYCAEDETVSGSTSQNYTVSDKHLRVPTLGERMKTANLETRVVSVAGKDRAAVMMGGHKVDELWWWDGKAAFVSYAGRATPPVVARANAATAALIARAQPALDTPAWCAAHDRAVDLGGGKTVGAGHFERAAGDATAFRVSPAYDAAILALAAGLIQDMHLGQGKVTDIISIGASATDYIGHSYGTEGAEMCIQLSQLDTTLGRFFAVLDRTGVDYEVVLTADHGGNDVPEREVTNGIPDASRVDVALAAANMGKAIAAKLGIVGPTLRGAMIPSGDIWLDAGLTAAQRPAVLKAAVAAYAAHPQVAAVFTAAQLRATPTPGGPPENWTLIQKARASFDPERSGDLVVLLKPRITAIPDTQHTYVATHGSPWDYDRRVRSCSGARAWRGSNIPDRSRRSISRRHWRRRSGSPSRNSTANASISGPGAANLAIDCYNSTFARNANVRRGVRKDRTMQATRSAAKPQPGCAIGHHRPYRVINEPDRPEIQRAICRDCGSDLVRTRATRRWLFSGLLG